MARLGCYFIVFIGCFLFQVSAQSVQYTVGHDNWNPDSLGNHRAVIHYQGSGQVAKVIIAWRRRDTDPQNRRVIVEDPRTHKRVLNACTGVINRESGEVYFQPTSGKGTYYIYYMPYRNEGRSNYPRGVYSRPDTTAAPAWLEAARKYAGKPNATCNEIQAINAFNSFYPMEVIATSAETRRLIQGHPGEDFLVFPEDRAFSIRMNDDLPQRWIQRGVTDQFSGQADRDENYSFQLGVYAIQPLSQVEVSFSDLLGPGGRTIPGRLITCINTDGINYDGTPVKKIVDMASGKVQALWCTLHIPDTLGAGTYSGTATIRAAGGKVKGVQIHITVSSLKAVSSGVGSPEKMTRLNWLNSTLAQENTVIDPYTPLQVSGNAVSLLGRKLIINPDGLPRQIQTFFNEEMTGYTSQPNNELSAPIHFLFSESRQSTPMPWKHEGLEFTRMEPGTVQWKALNTNDALSMEVSASLEFDGFASYVVKVTARRDVEIHDISLQIPFDREAARYMMGLGQKGGFLPDSLSWKWEVATRNQDGAWIGNVNEGLQYSLRDEKYVRPLNTNFYLQKPLQLPASWGNGDKGGITISRQNGSVVANNYSGSRSLKKGDVLYYNFTLLITPFHPLNTSFQWATRFYHRYNNLDTIRAEGATVVNIHHATPINPWINYPFIEWKKMKGYVDSAHRLGLRVKIYNTIRELSDHAWETFALRSLGHEVYSPGKGGGFSWLQEHIGTDYIAAWFVPELKDAALVNSGMNRWHNYYVEGMNWLVSQVGIDGIYLDDVAFDRVTMKRIKRVLTTDRHPGIIDLHSANQYNKNDGFNNSAMLYMEHFPYLNRLWFGEYFDYEKNTPDFFLTEVSGIPFGLMGEMLQGDGNPWRGMIYGMTNRLGWSEKSDPRPIWKLWNEIGMDSTDMIGYWSSACPVRTTDPKVLATVYRKKGLALISLASWADSTVRVNLKIDWDKLGIQKQKASLWAPEIAGFQPAAALGTADWITVEKGKGWLLVIREQ